MAAAGGRQARGPACTCQRTCSSALPILGPGFLSGSVIEALASISPCLPKAR